MTTHRFLPVNSGGSIRTANTLRELQRRHDVTVFSGYRGRRRVPEFETALLAEFPGSRSVYCGPPPKWLANAVTVIRDLLPVRLVPRPQGKARKFVERELRSGRYDIAVFDFLDATDFLPKSCPAPIVLFEHNVESDLLRDHAHMATSISKRVRTLIRAAGLRNVERAMVRRFDHTIAVSVDDAARLRALAGHSRVTAVPTGADIRNLRAHPLPPVDAPVVMFTGLMHYQPNVDAVTWFANEIWPRILAEVPGAKFVIAGREPSRAVRALASPAIEVTGEVADIGEEFRRATVAVVPLRVASGTRLKVYEAMACGRPVVSTRLGAAGLDVEHERDILFADSADDMARAVIRVLTDRDAAERLSAGAIETAARQSWENAARAFEAVLERVAAGR